MSYRNMAVIIFVSLRSAKVIACIEICTVLEYTAWKQ